MRLPPLYLQVFQFLEANSIGRFHALFYIAWAWVAERSGNYALADRLYATGLQRGAAPRNELHTVSIEHCDQSHYDKMSVQILCVT